LELGIDLFAEDFMRARDVRGIQDRLAFLEWASSRWLSRGILANVGLYCGT